MLSPKQLQHLGERAPGQWIFTTFPDLCLLLPLLLLPLLLLWMFTALWWSFDEGTIYFIHPVLPHYDICFHFFTLYSSTLLRTFAASTTLLHGSSFAYALRTSRSVWVNLINMSVDPFLPFFLQTPDAELCLDCVVFSTSQLQCWLCSYWWRCNRTSSAGIESKTNLFFGNKVSIQWNELPCGMKRCSTRSSAPPEEVSFLLTFAVFFRWTDKHRFSITQSRVPGSHTKTHKLHCKSLHWENISHQYTFFLTFQNWRLKSPNFNHIQ